MRPSEIRAELIGQHQALRTIMSELRAASASVAGDEPIELLVQEGLAHLAGALIDHNVREEELLMQPIARSDAWGPARVEVMGEAHYREHAALRDALHDVRTGATTCRRLALLFDQLLEHMACEERDILAEDFLRDPPGK
jgi:hypothetical protein